MVKKKKHELEGLDLQKADNFKNIGKIQDFPSDIHHREYSDEELKCENITTDQCAELRQIKFSNDPKSVFLEVRSLEERYKHEVNEAKKFWTDIIKKAKTQNAEKYRKALENKKKEINFEIEELKKEIEKNIRDLETQENMILSQIKMIYSLKKTDLIEQALNIIGFNF